MDLEMGLHFIQVSPKLITGTLKEGSRGTFDYKEESH